MSRDPVRQLRHQLVAAADASMPRSARLRAGLLAAAGLLVTGAAAAAAAGVFDGAEVDRGVGAGGAMSYRIVLRPGEARGEYCLYTEARNGSGPNRMAPTVRPRALLSSSQACARPTAASVIVVRTIEDVIDRDVVAGAVRREVASVEVHGPGRGEIRRVSTQAVEALPFRTFVAHVPRRRPPGHPLPRFTWFEPDLRPLVLLCDVLGRTSSGIEDVRRMLDDPSATCPKPRNRRRTVVDPGTAAPSRLVARDADGTALEVIYGDIRITRDGRASGLDGSSLRQVSLRPAPAAPNSTAGVGPTRRPALSAALPVR